MRTLEFLAGILLIAAVLADAFTTIVLPRRVSRSFGPARVFVSSSWRLWTWLARRLPASEGLAESGRQDEFLGAFGPLALLAFVALWAWFLVAGFALLYWGAGAPLVGAGAEGSFGAALYLSGVTFFTVGFGDIVPGNGLGRTIAVIEGSTGFGFLAVLFSYLPTIFTASAQREAAITRLDARAGSPPTAAGFLSRLGADAQALDACLREWEDWSAEVLENHLSHPILAFFRSQHERQSWLATLTLILDVTSLVLVGLGPPGALVPRRQARQTFAMARHALGDLCQVLRAPPRAPVPERLSPADRARLRDQLAAAGLPLASGAAADDQLAALRALYEPYAAALGRLVLLPLPAWRPAADAAEDWETTAWQHDPLTARAAVASREVEKLSIDKQGPIADSR
jgi:hypothetical protein